MPYSTSGINKLGNAFKSVPQFIFGICVYVGLLMQQFLKQFIPLSFVYGVRRP